VAPIIGVLTGLVITIINLLILELIWARVLPAYLQHHWMIVPGLMVGFLLSGLIMQFCTPDPDEHSTEEIIRSYHDHQGDIDIRPFWWKLLAAVTTVSSGGSAAMEGPSIYGGGAIGSWLWTKLRRFGLESRDRRIMARGSWGWFRWRCWDRPPLEKWDSLTVQAIADLKPTFFYEDCDLMEALRLLARENPDPMLLVTATDGELTGIVTKTDILRAVESTRGSPSSDSDR
jgi:hypothetical protein